jgi:integrase
VCNYVDKIKKTRTEHTFLNIESINQLIYAVKGDKIETAVLIAIYYGLRRSEVLGLTWDNIDFEENRLSVRQKVIRTFDDNHKLGICISNELKTNSSYRDFPLFPDIREHLIRVKENIRLNQQRLGNEYCYEYTNFVCVDETGVLLHPDYISSKYRKIVKKYNLPDSSFHSLRHSCASLLLANGYNIKEIQQWLGHSNYQTTSDIYSHTEDKFKDNIVNSLSEIIQYN